MSLMYTKLEQFIGDVLKEEPASWTAVSVRAQAGRLFLRLVLNDCDDDPSISKKVKELRVQTGEISEEGDVIAAVISGLFETDTKMVSQVQTMILDGHQTDLQSRVLKEFDRFFDTPDRELIYCEFENPQD